MDQNTILTALQKALAGGSGTLDDLDALLDRAKADIVKAKEEAAAKAEADRKAKELDKAKRAQRIADLANRLLEDKLTDDDVAMVFESYLKSNGMDVKVTAESVREGVKNSAELDQAMKELTEAFEELFELKNAKKPVDPDDAIGDFLKRMGL